MSPILLFGSYFVIFALAMYIFIYIPNKKKNRQKRELHDSIKPGDEIITISGIVGKVKAREGDYIILTIDEEKDINMKIVIYAVSNRIIKE